MVIGRDRMGGWWRKATVAVCGLISGIHRFLSLGIVILLLWNKQVTVTDYEPYTTHTHTQKKLLSLFVFKKSQSAPFLCPPTHWVILFCEFLMLLHEAGKKKVQKFYAICSACRGTSHCWFLFWFGFFLRLLFFSLSQKRGQKLPFYYSWHEIKG